MNKSREPRGEADSLNECKHTASSFLFKDKFAVFLSAISYDLDTLQGTLPLKSVYQSSWPISKLLGESGGVLRLHAHLFWVCLYFCLASYLWMTPLGKSGGLHWKEAVLEASVWIWGDDSPEGGAGWVLSSAVGPLLQQLKHVQASTPME